MIKDIYVIKKDEKNLTEHLDEIAHKDMVFRSIRKDTIGQSSSNPTWGYVFNVREGKLKLNIDGEGLYKEFDYDIPNAAYAEKISSIIGRNTLNNTRVPKTDVVMQYSGQPETISYKLLDNDKEDMFHIRDLMFYKYEREELEKKKNIFTIEDILYCVKQQVKNKENYEQVERSVIHTLLLDSIINNGDRHNNNWALVRNKETNFYELAVFDHSSTLTDMIEEQMRFTYNGWVSSYVNVGENTGVRRGSIGKDIIEYIAQNYKEYFDEFCEIFDEKLPSILEEIKGENLPINMRRLERKLYERKRFLEKTKSREEFEYGE